MGAISRRLNLALRGNLHIFFADGTERVHQVVLGQGHIDGGIFTTPTNNWWVGLEDPTPCPHAAPGFGARTGPVPGEQRSWSNAS